MERGLLTGVSEPRGDGRRPEPRWMTPTDLCVIVAGVALVMAMPSRASGWPFLLPSPSVLFVVLIGGPRLTVGIGLVLSLVVLFRRGRYGGPVRTSEWLALELASLGLLDAVPNLDDAVNSYYAAVGSTALDFGLARWLISAPAAAGVVLVVAALVFLGRPVRDGSRVAAALTALGIVDGFALWFWGPCEVARLELPWLLVPSPRGDPLTWGWLAPIVFGLRDMVATGPAALTWAIPAATTVRGWRAARRRGASRAWVWTELAAAVNIVTASWLLAVVGLTVGGPEGPIAILWRVVWLLGIGQVSWWITGRFGAGRVPSPPEDSPPSS